jgi:hypothetical protein
MRPYDIIEQEYLDLDLGGLDAKKLFDIVKDKKDPVLCIIKAGETSVVADWIDLFRERILEVKKNKPDLLVHLTASHFHRSHKQELREIVDSIMFSIADFVRPYYRLFVKAESQVSIQWKHDAEKFLFFIGKPDKYHRVGLLYKLDCAGLLEKCIWSLHVHDINIEKTTKILSDIGCQNPVEWIEQHLRNPDSVHMTVLSDSGSSHYSGIPFDTCLYDNAKFQLISETDFTNKKPPWATEKIGLAFANRNPFLLAGSPGTLKALNDLGFVTFDKFCLHKDYDLEFDDQLRMNKIIENVSYWIENIESYHHEIKQAVEHNFKRFLEIGQNELVESTKVCKALDIGCDPSEILPIFDGIAYADWKNWYQRIRDPQWPDCDREEDFYHLPSWIQKECIEVFGYTPKETK